MLVVVNEKVATPALLIATGDPCATLSSRNCTVPVGAAPKPVVVDVNAIFVPWTTADGVPVSVVVDKVKPIGEVSGVTELQWFTKLNTSSEPQPVARSYPTPAA